MVGSESARGILCDGVLKHLSLSPLRRRGRCCQVLLVHSRSHLFSLFESQHITHISAPSSLSLGCGWDTGKERGGEGAESDGDRLPGSTSWQLQLPGYKALALAFATEVTKVLTLYYCWGFNELRYAKHLQKIRAWWKSAEDKNQTSTLSLCAFALRVRLRGSQPLFWEVLS